MAKSGTSPIPEILLVFNPQAGSARQDLLRRLLQKYFADRKVELLEIDSESDTGARIRPYLEKGVHLVIVAGGDGTISTVASEMVNSNVPLGILPLGTGNVLARELAIPINPSKAAQLLAANFAVRRIDAIRVQERVFLLAVSVGLSALTMQRVRNRHKRRFGRLAYLWAFLLNLTGLPQQEFALEVDGQSMQVRANELMAVNAGAIGYKAVRWGPDVQPDDAQLDLCFIRARTLPHYFQVFLGILSRQEYRTKRLKCISVKEEIRINSPADLLIQGDGDLIGRTPVTISFLPAALKIAVPV